DEQCVHIRAVGDVRTTGRRAVEQQGDEPTAQGCRDLVREVLHRELRHHQSLPPAPPPEKPPPPPNPPKPPLKPPPPPQPPPPPLQPRPPPPNRLNAKIHHKMRPRVTIISSTTTAIPRPRPQRRRPPPSPPKPPLKPPPPPQPPPPPLQPRPPPLNRLNTKIHHKMRPRVTIISSTTTAITRPAGIGSRSVSSRGGGGSPVRVKPNARANACAISGTPGVSHAP